MKPSKKDLEFLKRVRESSEDYKKGFLDGYKKSLKDSDKIRKEVRKKFMPLNKLINELKKLH